MARIVRFVHAQTGPSPRYGVLEDDGQVAVIEPHPFTRFTPSGARVPLEGLHLLAPVIPSKIVCVGKNYRDHVAEMGGEVPAEPLLFLKPSSSVIGPGEPIRLPTDLSDEVHHEAEVAVVIGKLLQRVTPEQALDGILGYTAANDVTARDWQRRESQWFRGKGFDTFCPLGPAIATGLDAADLRVRCWVDDELRQDGTTADLVFDVARLVAEASQVVTLLPSDVLLTGTPAGVGPLLPGQRVRVEIDGVGTLENPVVDRQAGATAETRSNGHDTP
ncbi:fumarylacetoacetate hydrolase family protein [Egicoccus halophilus]|uniref:2-hydroxyhepta-2,4-diene-1,7-dioate isomerase n=1 Tax=Egicoccus halophilus TaxID=1670830 RepID=A0A8J3A824_9ACTN|nr:fumarylacetoacetate hydrolase family protein [Egicoccus halophilus]GGI06358.1 2-hydroxyhepta-2,4-diene-1,7-dioate isomerase [Egicoccus halophilus]